MKHHYKPQCSVIVKRLKFTSRVCQSRELVAAFVAELWHLAVACEFGDNLEKMLRDCMVCGINDSHMQWHLLAESKLSLETALEIAQIVEATSQDTIVIQPQPPSHVNVFLAEDVLIGIEMPSLW